MSKVTPPLSTTPPSTPHVQSLIIRLNGITAGDYLAWVRDPEPPALDHSLRSVAVSAEPLGDLVHVELIWGGPATNDTGRRCGRCWVRADP
jgi:hypothetical protein